MKIPRLSVLAKRLYFSLSGKPSYGNSFTHLKQKNILLDCSHTSDLFLPSWLEIFDATSETLTATRHCQQWTKRKKNSNLIAALLLGSIFSFQILFSNGKVIVSYEQFLLATTRGIHSSSQHLLWKTVSYLLLQNWHTNKHINDQCWKEYP